MVYLSDVIRPDVLQDSLSRGLIRYQHHPSLPYVIYNYTERAQWAGIWNEATRQCRGLIVNTLTNKVVARPFPKFFNYGEHTVDIGPNEPVVSTDKLDGSLGILYPDVDGYSVATRGSFSSDQSRHATGIWKKCYEEVTDVPDDLTLLFEIIYPENRIVLDYGETDDLFLLGGVEIRSGRSIDPDQIEWVGPVVRKMDHETLSDALEAPDRAGAEGVVVWFPDSDNRVKEDEPNNPVRDLVSDLHRSGDHIIFVSARTDDAWHDTVAWLWDHLDLGRFRLFMRRVGDYRKDAIVKQEIFDELIRDQFNVRFVIDDRNQVVRMWRSLGLTCLQVADGDF